jgi:hypothetical protein
MNKLLVDERDKKMNNLKTLTANMGFAKLGADGAVFQLLFFNLASYPA